MTQRTIARICILTMVPVGIAAGVFVTYFVPHLIATIEATGSALPVYLRVFLAIGRHNWFFSSFYILLLIAVIVWYCTAKPQQKTP